MPRLFDPYELKGVKLRNRIAVSPMCQYMAHDGLMNEWHAGHYAALARGGSGLTIVEATAVSPEGRITWADLGLWNDEQAAAMEPVVRGISSYGSAPGIQIAHAGRKASSNRPWEGDDQIDLGEPNSWETIAASSLAFGANLSRVPQEMTFADIMRVQRDTVAAVKRARDIGMQWLQLHYAHGYLAQNFFYPGSNHREDVYGGHGENRARFLVETFQEVRKVWPEERPLTVRLGIANYDGRDGEMLGASIDLLRVLRDNGLDMVDVSLGFNTPGAAIPWAPHFLADLTATIRRETKLAASTSWYISEPREADQLIQDENLDMVLLGRPLLTNPHWPYLAAKELGIADPALTTLPMPYAHWLERYR